MNNAYYGLDLPKFSEAKILLIKTVTELLVDVKFGLNRLCKFRDYVK